ncbi:hypothetical protein BJF88_02710 [Cellulosimicrobium sp. CUA-896]|nr:hypothetical protein BJF88_02710 [Cellulosimicrobium sp. CUA-896]
MSIRSAECPGRDGGWFSSPLENTPLATRPSRSAKSCFTGSVSSPMNWAALPASAAGRTPFGVGGSVTSSIAPARRSSSVGSGVTRASSVYVSPGRRPAAASAVPVVAL